MLAWESGLGMRGSIENGKVYRNTTSVMEWEWKCTEKGDMYDGMGTEKSTFEFYSEHEPQQHKRHG